MNKDNTQKVVLAVITVFAIAFLFDTLGSGLTGNAVWQGWGGCSATKLCGDGEGDCDNDNECSLGLKCVDNVGRNYGFSSVADVCQSQPQAAAGKPTTPCPSSRWLGDINPNEQSCSGTTLMDFCYDNTNKGFYKQLREVNSVKCGAPVPPTAPIPTYPVQTMNYKGEKVLCNGNYDLDNDGNVEYDDWILFAQKFQKKENSINYNKDLLVGNDIINDYDTYCFKYFGFSPSANSAGSCGVVDSYRCSLDGLQKQEKCIANVWTVFNDCSASLTGYSGCYEGQCVPSGASTTPATKSSATSCNYNQDCYVNQGDTFTIDNTKIKLVSVSMDGAVALEIDSDMISKSINPSNTAEYSPSRFIIRNKQIVYNPSVRNGATLVITRI